MPSTIHLDVVTPESLVYSDDIKVLEAPTLDGIMGMLPRHAPMITGLEIGVLQIGKAGEEEKMLISISEGFMEVKPDKINVVVRTAELQHEIDVERAERARDRAQERLDSPDDKTDEVRAEAALRRSLARLKAARKHRRRNRN